MFSRFLGMPKFGYAKSVSDGIDSTKCGAGCTSLGGRGIAPITAGGYAPTSGLVQMNLSFEMAAALAIPLDQSRDT